MLSTRWWQWRSGRPERGDGPERALALRERLEALELERLELLADERVPGRKHRLDALAAARQDLRAELDRLEPVDDEADDGLRVGAATCRQECG